MIHCKKIKMKISKSPVQGFTNLEVYKSFYTLKSSNQNYPYLDFNFQG